MRFTSLWIGAATAAVLVLTPVSGADAAANCVVNVTSNTTLWSNSPSCEYHVAPGVTLDLNGRTVGAVAFGTLPGTATATVRNGRVNPAGLATPPVASIATSGPPIVVSRVTVVSGDIAGTTSRSTIVGSELRAGAIALNGGTHSISNNTLTGGGVLLTNANGSISGNILHGNNGAGVGMTVTGNVQVTGNSITGHFIGVAARIGPFNSIAIRGNFIVGNLSTGVLVEHIVGTASVTHNLVAGNGYGVSPGSGAGAGDGIYVNVLTSSSTPPVLVADNTAYENAWIGINGVSGVTDGGGNRAGSNHGPAQCAGVACGSVATAQMSP